MEGLNTKENKRELMDCRGSGLVEVEKSVGEIQGMERIK